MINNPLMNLDKDQNVFSEYYQLLKNIVQSPHSEFRINAVRHLTLAMFYGYSHMKHDIRTCNKSTNRQDDIYSAFLKTIGKHYKTQRTVGFYADLNFPSQSVFGKYVKRVTGMSPKEYKK